MISRFLTRFLLCCCFFNGACLPGKAQDTLRVEKAELVILKTLTPPVKTYLVNKKSLTPLPKALYQINDGWNISFVHIVDSGFVDGDWDFFQANIIQRKSQWIQGLQQNEHIYSDGILRTETKDSTAMVYVYDSVAKEWKLSLRNIVREKQFTRDPNEWTINYLGGPHRRYAAFYFRGGSLRSKYYIDYLQELYNDSAALVFKQEYNWRKKQMETYDFIKGIIYKRISRNNNWTWQNNGVIEQSFPSTGDDLHTEYYVSGKLVRKEVTKLFKKTTTEYTPAGKVASSVVTSLSPHNPGVIEIAPH
ncbi:MAG: hypothetical protein EOO13_14090 [Chitinophagaceae bacterium]|nr:MAG: hypothetical protein EOO13_14090 [Chitinophagaceae bacterium]